jgi:hypothetical protein
MRKGFTRKPQRDEPATPGKNYITPSGLQRLKDEHRFLLTRERPAVTEVVAWAASNGDRSENADYQYGKRRPPQIDGRIRFLDKTGGQNSGRDKTLDVPHFQLVEEWRKPGPRLSEHFFSSVKQESLATATGPLQIG